MKYLQYSLALLLIGVIFFGDHLPTTEEKSGIEMVVEAKRDYGGSITQAANLLVKGRFYTLKELIELKNVTKRSMHGAERLEIDTSSFKEEIAIIEEAINILENQK